MNLNSMAMGFIHRAIEVTERACEESLVGGVCGVRVTIRAVDGSTPNSFRMDYVAEVHPDVPYGHIEEVWE